MRKDKNKYSISIEDVSYAARLSRIELESDKMGKFREQLNDILVYIDQLNEVDTEGVAPTSHVLTSMRNVFREDEPGTSLPNEKALANAPAKSGNFFKVPKIIKES
ncbi:MAG: Asp-tRNA(Asn)/Glu-tRNA(Gln) amidotransferase subunit GatC [Candidatus Omnitrophica bacterium]|nr:Asp-tRNA(Asn)/Glu-tRNA(Gln) amidotransferase subunit GatC [Candidatus Omnitrophota bacterium]